MPFTVGQFFDVFARYNTALGPWVVLAYAAGIAVVACVWRGGEVSSRWIAAMLALLWTFVGVVYHSVFFAPINPAAWLFALLFIAQGALLAEAAVSEGDWTFERRGWPAALGVAAMAYALIVYPLLGLALGHGYPRSPLFGVAPCPLTIFTLGVLMVARHAPRRLFVVPIAWSGIGGSAAWLLDVPEDFGLIAAGLLTVAVLLARRPDPRVA